MIDSDAMSSRIAHPMTSSVAPSHARRAVALGACLIAALSACGSGSSTSATSTTTVAPATTVATSAAQATTATTTTATTGAATGKPTTAVTSATTVAPATSPAGVAGGLTSIVVPSTPDQYFVLYVKPNPDLPVELPISITKGQAGTTNITDGRAQLPQDRYRVATFEVSAPGDVDGDGIDDITELNDPAGKNALNPAKALKATDGAVTVVDRAAYETLSYQGSEVARDAYLAGQEFVKFWIVGANTEHPAVYFMNTNTFRAHPMFANAIGLPSGRAQGTMRGDIVWDPAAIGPSGSAGAYRFAFQENDALPFAEIAVAYEVLAAQMPFLSNNLMYYPLPQAAMPLYVSKEKPLYDASRVPVLLKKG
jgi:hypothetical protein